MKGSSVKGFSIVELLIVVAIILIISAIGVPSFLSAKAKADKASAIMSLRKIQSAEIDYQNQWGDYTQQLSQLPIPQDLQTGKKSGYWFLVRDCARRQRSFSGKCFVVMALPMRQNKWLNFRTDSMCADDTGFVGDIGSCN